jgi:hypothetical protein
VFTGRRVPMGFPTTVDTKVDRDNIKALYSSMKTTSEQIDVSVLTIYLIASPCHGFDSFLLQALVKHSRDKDQFLKVAIK